MNLETMMRENLPQPYPKGLFNEEAYMNRELSQIEFFKRVLSLATLDQTPTLEKLKFITICSSIIDEFFEIRIPSIKERSKLDLDHRGPDGLRSRQLLKKIHQEISGILKEQYQILNNEVWPALEKEGISFIKRPDWNQPQKEWARKYFVENVAPLITPIGLDPAHPFPIVLNKSLNMLLVLEGKDGFGRRCEYAVLNVPRCLPRILQLPPEAASDPKNIEFVMISSIVHANAHLAFPGMKVKGCHPFRLTRDADFSVEEDIDDLLDALKSELPDRRYGDAIRLEVSTQCPHEIAKFLLKEFALSEHDLYKVNGPLNLHRFIAICDAVDRPDLKYPAFVPTPYIAKDLFDTLQRKDLLFHHPFQSFSTIVDFIRQASADPNVLAIKQTLYRTGNQSPIVEALIDAAKLGKEVTAVIELRARFDEAANIDLAARLQAAGAHVVYGVVNYKTHAKMLMVVRRETSGLKRYVHLGTGNYHAGTAKSYTDFSFLTADQEIGEDVHQIFLQLTGVAHPQSLTKLIEAPFSLINKIKELIAFEIAEATAGRPAKIIFKVNALIDPVTIELLYEASQAGVQIDLIVRGACAVKPKIPKISENIRVRCIVGRFLEHSRIFFFEHAGQKQIYLSSADLMQRNLYRRVESAFPILNEELKKRVMEEGLTPYLNSTINTWEIESDGTCIRVVDLENQKRLSTTPTVKPSKKGRSRKGHDSQNTLDVPVSDNSSSTDHIEYNTQTIIKKSEELPTLPSKNKEIFDAQQFLLQKLCDFKS
jgi:polyphosphate kinase